MIVDYTIEINYTDDDAPILSETDIRNAIINQLHDADIDANGVIVERQ